MSWRHESHYWDQLQASVAEVDRVAGLIAETQPQWSEHLKRITQAVRDGYAGDAPVPEAATRDAQDAIRYRYLRGRVFLHPYMGMGGSDRDRDSLAVNLPQPPADVQLLRGSLAGHLDAAIDAALTMNKGS